MKAFARSRGTHAKTDRIDTALIARFFAFRPDAGRCLPAEKLLLLRALGSKCAQLVKMHERQLAQIPAHQELGTAEMFDDIDADLKAQLDMRIKELEARIGVTTSSD